MSFAASSCHSYDTRMVPILVATVAFASRSDLLEHWNSPSLLLFSVHEGCLVIIFC